MAYDLERMGDHASSVAKQARKLAPVANGEATGRLAEMGRLTFGIDIGGTFTDVVAYEADTRSLHVAKVPSTPGRLAEGFLGGISRILEELGAAPGDVERVVHGTTIGTNAVLEHRGATLGILTTAGFEDVLPVGRHKRSELYNLRIGAEEIPQIILYNKIDRLESAPRVDRDAEGRIEAVWISAQNRLGMDLIADTHRPIARCHALVRAQRLGIGQLETLEGNVGPVDVIPCRQTRFEQQHRTVRVGQDDAIERDGDMAV